MCRGGFLFWCAVNTLAKCRVTNVINHSFLCLNFNQSFHYLHVQMKDQLEMVQLHGNGFLPKLEKQQEGQKWTLLC